MEIIVYCQLRIINPYFSIYHGRETNFKSLRSSDFSLNVSSVVQCIQHTTERARENKMLFEGRRSTCCVYSHFSVPIVSGLSNLTDVQARDVLV